MIIILCIVPWTTCILAYLSQLHVYLRNCLHLRYTNFLTLYCKSSICIIKNLPFTRCHAFYVIYQYVHLKYTNLRSFDLDATFKCPLHQCLKKKASWDPITCIYYIIFNLNYMAVASATIEHTLVYDSGLYTIIISYHVPCSVASAASRFPHWAFASSPRGQCRPGECLSPTNTQINN